MAVRRKAIAILIAAGVCLPRCHRCEPRRGDHALFDQGGCSGRACRCGLHGSQRRQGENRLRRGQPRQATYVGRRRIARRCPVDDRAGQDHAACRQRPDAGDVVDADRASCAGKSARRRRQWIALAIRPRVVIGAQGRCPCGDRLRRPRRVRNGAASSAYARRCIRTMSRWSRPISPITAKPRRRPGSPA